MHEAASVTLRDCERILGIPANKWKGRCHEVACGINRGLKLGWRECYGAWWGKIAPGTFFSDRSGPVRHGWLATPDGRIFDPTRWVFEGRKPYLWLSPSPCDCEMVCSRDGTVFDDCGHAAGKPGVLLGKCRAVGYHDYDFGAERLRGVYRGGPPARKTGDKVVDFQLDDEAAAAVMQAIFPDYPQLTVEQVCWVANGGPLEWDSCLGPIHRRVVAMGLRGFIPIDFLGLTQEPVVSGPEPNSSRKHPRVRRTGLK